MWLERAAWYLGNEDSLWPRVAVPVAHLHHLGNLFHLMMVDYLPGQINESASD